MKDLFKQQRKLLRPMWSFEFRGKSDKTLNRRIVRKKLKVQMKNELD